jgi:hypothetical protein
MSDQYEPRDFSRRRYTVEGDQLDNARKIELRVFIDGQQLVHVQAREPGILAFVSKPNEPGFDLEIVEQKGARYSDVRTISGEMTEPLAPWMLEALDVR